ncbi:MAG: hypothetical protein Kow0092_13770 [Deferrisomatales bacterium]
MTVQLKFFAGLRRFLPPEPSPYPVEVAPGTTVRDLLTQLGVPPDKPKILLVNGRHANLDRELRDGDELSAFPPVAGG